MRMRLGLIAAGALALAGCQIESAAPKAPPRASDPVTIPAAASHVAVDLAVDLGALERALEQRLPRTLWTINRKDMDCVPSRRLDLELVAIKTPRVTCDITGTATRGRLRLSGKGRALIVTLPVRARVAARDIAGVLKGETATAAADVVLRLTLDLAPDWRIIARPDLSYRWAREPGIDFLGQRIRFASAADKELRPLTQQIEREIARELARLELREAATRGWRAAHTVLELNARNPAVWARLTPQRFLYGGYRANGQQLTLSLGLDGMVETIVGARPEPPAPTPLPPLARLEGARNRASLAIPVVADYAVLEPVIARALAKRTAQPIPLKDYGSVTARIDKVEAYGTTGQRIAVGVSFAATSDLALVDKAQGTVWLVGRPVNQPDSRMIDFADVEITGATGSLGGDLLLALANTPEFNSAIAAALRQNFENDFTKLRAKIDAALAQRVDGPVAYSVTIDKLGTGTIEAHGQGLFLPVSLEATIRARLLGLGGVK
ncbi:MAG: DUF4403 family protein [Erythrobacter cryptus]